MFEQLVRKLKEKFNDQLIILLFGSRGRGDHSVISDFDVLCIIPNEISEDENSELRQLSLRHSTDLFIYSISQIADLIKNHNSILLMGFSEGKVIFDGLDKYAELYEKVVRK
jgi:predicted nucleotidyltransferase